MPVSGRYDSDDNRWREQVADLVRDLRVETESLTVQRTPVPGTEGSLRRSQACSWPCSASC